MAAPVFTRVIVGLNAAVLLLVGVISWFNPNFLFADGGYGIYTRLAIAMFASAIVSLGFFGVVAAAKNNATQIVWSALTLLIFHIPMVPLFGINMGGLGILYDDGVLQPFTLAILYPAVFVLPLVFALSVAHRFSRA